MWLVNTATLTLEQFFGEQAPPYVILSHTWGDGELTFQEFQQAHNHSAVTDITRKAGYLKISAACQQAQLNGYQYAWVDTCCIDKTSSAELNEGINSMFGWYRRSQVCYSLLSDIFWTSEEIDRNFEGFVEAFRQSRWFTRGWCLQELLAPRHIRFFNANWHEIGTKTSLLQIISQFTGIPQAVLTSPPQKDVYEYPVATRISWIARRRTTREEDMAYSLLGILGINMPMLYGEGKGAFRRLQEEIIRKYNDLSIFAWPGLQAGHGFSPMLAPSPTFFARDITPAKSDTTTAEDSGAQLGDRLRTQFTLTNQGLYFPTVRLYTCTYRRGAYHYLLMLDHRDASFTGIAGNEWYVLLQKVGPGLFVRCYQDENADMRGRVAHPCHDSVCIIDSLSPTLTKQLSLWKRNAVRVRWKAWSKGGRRYWNMRAMEPKANWDHISGQFLVEMASEKHMHVEFVPGNYDTNPNYEYFVIAIQVIDKDAEDPRKRMAVKLIDSKDWPGVNHTPIQWENMKGVGALLLEEGAYNHHQKTQKQKESEVRDSDTRISMVGYNMSVSVEVVHRQDEPEPYHLIYLHWEESKRSFPRFM